MATAPNSYKDPFWSKLAAAAEQKHDLPSGLLVAAFTKGERSNNDQVSEADARTVFQITKTTRNLFLKRDGIDAYLNPQNAAEVAALVMKDGVNWAKQRGAKAEAIPRLAAGYYHGGGNTKNWGDRTLAYMQRVAPAVAAAAKEQVDPLARDFAAWMKANPAVPTQPQQAAPTAQAGRAAPQASADPMVEDFRAWMASGQKSGADLIPGQAPGVVAPAATWAPTPDTSGAGFGDQLIGLGEAGLTAATGMTGGALGMAGGAVKGAVQQIANGQFGTPQGANAIEQAAAEGAQALTYQPRTAVGQVRAGQLGEAMQAAIPVMPMTAELATLGRAAAPAGMAARTGAAAVLNKAATAAPAAVQKVAAVPGRIVDAVTLRQGQPRPAATPGTMGSVGAAGTDMAAQRQALANSFDTPIPLTRGQASRNSAQLKFEAETAKIPDAGAPLRERLLQQNDAILRNMETWIDQTGAEAPSLRTVGAIVDKAVVEKAKRAKTEVNVLYRRADKSPEAEAIVDQSVPVSLGEGESAMTATPIDYLNSKPAGLATTGLLDHARQYALKIGIAENQGGDLVPRPATIKQMEAWRKEISQATGYEPMDIRDSSILKGLIDGQTEPVAGPMYRQARSARALYAKQFEDRAVINKLMSTKRGTSDRAVAFEDVFDHSILKGSLDDVRHMRRVLQTGGADGQQAWRELQGATMRHVYEQATKSVAADSTGNRVVSPSALKKTIEALDADGKLDFIFGKQGAQRLRDINDFAQLAKTVPPEAAINHSNTAMTLMAGFGDIFSSGLTGMPFPAITGMRMALSHIKDVRLRNRIRDALGEIERKQAPNNKRNAPKVQEPHKDKAFH